MNIENLKNIELLYKQDLEGKIVVKIPNTIFHLIFTHVKTSDKWKIHVLELYSARRVLIGNNFTRNQAKKILLNIINPAETVNLKTTKNIKQFAKQLLEVLKI